MLRAKCIELHDTWKTFDLHMHLQFLAILVEIYQKDPELDPNNFPEKLQCINGIVVQITTAPVLLSEPIHTGAWSTSH